MNSILQRLIIIGASLILVSGCRTSSPTAAGSPADSMATMEQALDSLESDSELDVGIPVTHPSEGNPDSLAHFAAGVSYALRDEQDLAMDEFYKSALADPHNEPLVVEVSRSFLAKKQAGKAVLLLSKAAHVSQSSVDVQCWLAQALLETGKTNEAVAAARVAVKKSGASIEGEETLCAVCLRAGRTHEALKVLSRMEKKAGGRPLALIATARLYAEYLQTHPADAKSVKLRAVRLLDKVDVSKPGNQLLLQRLAETYRYLDEPGKAAEMLLKLLPKNPKPSPQLDALRERLANLFLMGGDNTHAAEQLEAIVKDNPSSYPQVWYVLGTLAGDEKQYSKAIGYFQKALLLDSSIEQAYYQLALAQIDVGQTGEALDTLEKAAVRFPNTFVGEFFTGVAYSRLKRYDEAMKHLTSAEVIAKATDAKRLTPQFYFQIGAAAERNHQFEIAVGYFEKALQLDPGFYEAMNYLGYMWVERGQNLDRARSMIEKAVKAEPTNGAFLDSLGWVFFKQNKAKEALPVLLKAVAYTPEPDATVFEHLGDVYMALGQKEKACEAWGKALKIEPNDEISKKLKQASGS